MQFDCEMVNGTNRHNKTVVLYVEAVRSQINIFIYFNT